MPTIVGQTLLPGSLNVAEDTPTIVGASDQLSDSDDATYASLTTVSYTRFDGVSATLSNADAGDTRDPLFIRYWARASATRTGGGTVYLIAGVTPPTLGFTVYQNLAIPADGATHEVEYDVDDAYFSGFWGSSVDAFVNDLEAGTIGLHLNNAGTGSSNETSVVYQWELRIMYDQSYVPKVIRRVYPRDDRNRVYPQPRSMQQGRRAGGSTYF